MNIKALLLAIASLTLTACGGGGSESTSTPLSPAPSNSTVGSGSNDSGADAEGSDDTDDTDQPDSGGQTQTASLTFSASTAVTVEEQSHEDIEVDFDYNGTEALSLSVSVPQIDGVDISYTLADSSIIFTVDVLDVVDEALKTVNLTAELTDGNVTASLSQTVRIINTSLKSDIADLENAVSLLDEMTDTSELFVLATYLADKAYLYGIMSSSDTKTWLSEVKSEVNEVTANFTGTASSQAASILDNKDVITESDFAELIVDFNSTYSGLADSLNFTIEAFNALEIPNTPKFATLKQTYVGGYSLFYGNESYGDYLDGSWTFKEQYTLLEDIIPTDTQVCLASN